VKPQAKPDTFVGYTSPSIAHGMRKNPMAAETCMELKVIHISTQNNDIKGQNVPH
jgi:hypothetical protein